MEESKNASKDWREVSINDTITIYFRFDQKFLLFFS